MITQLNNVQKNFNSKHFVYLIKEIFDNGNLFTIDEKATVNYFLDVYQAKGTLSPNDIAKFDALYVKLQKRKGYAIS